jgi:hypothetical protein
MTETRHPLFRPLTAFDAGSAARSLRRVAAAARLLMYVAPALRFVMDVQTYLVTTLRNGGFSGGQKVGRMLIGVGDSVFSNVIPLWITFAFIWFFAAWFARIAEKRAEKQ